MTTCTEMEHREQHRPSFYNFFIRERQGRSCLLFNGLRTSLIRLPPALTRVARDMLAMPQVEPSHIPSELHSFLSMLVQGGFLIDNACDELGMIRERLKNAREDKCLHLIIAPTLDCNLGCSYCYQARRRGTMNIEVCRQIIQFVREELASGEGSGIRLDWYGGEPLLARNVIAYLSEQLLQLSSDFRCNYEASIATNGTLLDASAGAMLLACRVKSCQVTIDGNSEIHNLRRPYRDGRPSFDTILKNIRTLWGKMDIAVRINLDTENVRCAEQLLAVFQEEGFFASSNFGFFPYVAMVSPINLCKLPPCGVLNAVEFYKLSLEFQQVVFAYSDKKRLQPIFDFPHIVNTACGALRRNTYGVDPEGFYFKCGLEIGDDTKRCGHVATDTQWAQCSKWRTYDPLDDQECAACRYLPFCMGGCPKVQFDQNLHYSKDGCSYWKNNLEEIVRVYVQATAEMSELSSYRLPMEGSAKAAKS